MKTSIHHVMRFKGSVISSRCVRPVSFEIVHDLVHSDIIKIHQTDQETRHIDAQDKLISAIKQCINPETN